MTALRVEIDADELEALRRELSELRARRDDLLEANTRLVEERRAIDRSLMVRQFHREVGLPAQETPTVPTAMRARLWLLVIAKEFFGLLGSMLGHRRIDAERVIMQEIDDVAVVALLPSFSSALAGIVYAVESTALEFGIPLDAAFAEVHRACMTRTPPDVAGVLRAHGWRA